MTAGSRERSRLVAHAWPGLRSAGLGPRSCLCGKMPLLARGPPQLEDPPGSGNRYQESPEDGREEQRDAQLQMSVSAEVANLNTLAVLQDENEQQK